MNGYLVLEDGSVFAGRPVAAPGAAFGEAVFTTGMTGYQETVTDPSFAGQLVCFSAPMVGNYGIGVDRLESPQPWVKAVLMRRCGGEEWATWLASHGVVALDGIDTRALVLHLRDAGSMRGVVVADRARLPVADALDRVRAQPEMEGQALVAAVSRLEPAVYNEDGRVRVAVVDYGAKTSIMRRLRQAGASVTVFPHTAAADELATFDGVLLSNGPAIRSRWPARWRRFGSCSDGRTCSGSASGTSCSASRRATRRTSCPSAIAVRTTRCSSVPRAAFSSRVRTTASRSDRATPPRRRISRSTTAPSKASTFRAQRPVGAVSPGSGAWHARRMADSRALGRAAGRRLMPARRDIESICVIGSGPIVIGQACEFDYAGCQALKVLREDGYRTVVINSNPATIMTDPGFADRTYIEPLDLEGVTDVLRRERPDAILPTSAARRP